MDALHQNKNDSGISGEYLAEPLAGEDLTRENEDGRDWDPYKVWQNHIMDVCPDAVCPPKEGDGDGDGWQPYKVWESLFKS